MSEIAETLNDPHLPEEPPKKKPIYLWLILGITIVTAICYFTGILNFNIYGGRMKIENLNLTNDENMVGNPNNRPMTSFDATDRIDGWVETSGASISMGMRWFHEDELIYEQLGRPKDNLFGTFISGTAFNPLPSGNYRVEAFFGNGSAEKTLFFTVNEYEQDIQVVPPQPTPQGHIDIENAPYFEVPFVFNEIWELNDKAVTINEVKITFFQGEVLFVVVVESEADLADLTDRNARLESEPIAQYALQNGYLEQAEAIEINGNRYVFSELDESVVVTLFSIDSEGGYRTRFNVVDLEN